jgi:sporulation protein YtfJ
MTIQDIISEVTKELENIVSAKTVVGEPIVVGGKTLIPITKISVGFGSGGFENGGASNSAGSKSPYGGGGGAGAKIEPVAFIVIDDDKTEILTLKESQLEDELAKFISMIPGIIDKIKKTKKEKSKSKVIEVNDE